MTSIAERILFLFELNNEIPTQILPQLGLSKSSMSDWKRGKSIPSTEAIIKLSEHFQVSTDYLLKGLSPSDNKFTDEEQALMDLFKKLNLLNNKKSKDECIAFLKGYIQAFIDMEKTQKKGR